MAWKTRTILSLLAVGVLGCGPDITEAASDDVADTGTGTGDSEEIGDVETGTSDSSTGTTDDTDATSDTATSEESTSDTSTSEESTGDMSTSEESTDTSTTDTVMDTACTDPTSFTVLAIDFSEVSGFWTETMSTLGEGQVMSMPQDQTEGVLTYDLEIPCDDTWHIWVRAIQQQTLDSFWIAVDGEPIDWAIFELDCTDQPLEAAYLWKEINWRDPNAGGCQYLQDPWVHDWGAGKHRLELGFRESWAISKIWVSNTGGAPP